MSADVRAALIVAALSATIIGGFYLLRPFKHLLPSCHETVFGFCVVRR